jgi:hypothetical protein
MDRTEQGVNMGSLGAERETNETLRWLAGVIAGKAFDQAATDPTTAEKINELLRAIDEQEAATHRVRRLCCEIMALITIKPNG